MSAPIDTRLPVETYSTDQNRTSVGQVLGTPAYMPPEQARGRFDLMDQRSDVYSLGAVLYQIITGKTPYSGSDTYEIVRKVLNEEPPPPRTINPKLTAALEAVCTKAMSKEKEGRYESAAELAQEMKRYLADEPVKAYDGTLYRLHLWVKRHVAGVAATVAAGVVAGGGLGYTAFVEQKHQAERDRAAATRKHEDDERARVTKERIDNLTKQVVATTKTGIEEGQKGNLDVAIRQFSKASGMCGLWRRFATRKRTPRNA